MSKAQAEQPVLANKEAKLFRELLSHYEEKHLTKGRKTADQILKKHPNHGETLAMKGLILVHLGQREEGKKMVKQGAMLNMKSHIPWHVQALIHKGEKDYDGALRAYKNGLKADKDNINILRDACFLLTHLRKYDELVEYRHRFLQLRPVNRTHWIGLAVAHHLNGNLAEAKNILEWYDKFLKSTPDYDADNSERLLYHVRVLEELGENTEALAFLDKYAQSRYIVHRTSTMEYRARLTTKLKSSDAPDAWRVLIEQNSDCWDYYKGFLSVESIDYDSITDENRAAALKHLNNFSQQYPRATAPRRMALSVATGDDFTNLATAYLSSNIQKGVPSLFVDVKPLYTDPAKAQSIQSIVEKLLEAHNTPPAPPPAENGSASAEPTARLWALYFLAQHHSHLGAYSTALELLDAAMAHTPTLPELYMARARVLKRVGDPYGAARVMNEARLLDGQDRYLNTKCGKYRLRAGLVSEAGEVFGMFTKKDAVSPGADLEEMQSLLYLREEGDAHYRAGRLSQALKKYYAVSNVFDQVENDQYDFHPYSLRRTLLNVYVNTLKWEDSVRSHPAYRHAAVSAARIWVSVYDDPKLAEGPAASDSATSGSDSVKKAKSKAAKKAAQTPAATEKNGTANAQQQNTNEDKGLEPPQAKDEDPEGARLIREERPLERAQKLLAPLWADVARGVWDVETCAVAYDVAVRRERYLEAARALARARSIDAEHPEVHVRTVELKLKVQSLSAPAVSETALAALVESLATALPDELSLETFNSQYLQRHAADGGAVLGAARAARVLQAPLAEVEETVFSALQDGVALKIETALAALAFLRSIESSRADEFRAACDARFELATVFKAPEELERLRKESLGEPVEVKEETLE
ncbi:N-terminal acetyltransferase A, auxiliary subunit [Coniophora puteana RWD-64-598 SS2]|uniref:N-terminal acetyltransferase A, auxiliary subunit n=1 Tax=Coniophora puteana (strain RWD-64-598) TaxID=741705 RepID=A0A5M3MDY0_CONPW|nr:N-terminal acetyltransferase A, auxiliary subunit [Coniophora puteana RWD-64-598 SS2]EIW77090.1 N-terminal acetyltransferase A, auxiliary subunit [Coniophora puteana RWD-64-598 SS2]